MGAAAVVAAAAAAADPDDGGGGDVWVILDLARTARDLSGDGRIVSRSF
jgi:hypothetical protein